MFYLSWLEFKYMYLTEIADLFSNKSVRAWLELTQLGYPPRHKFDVKPYCTNTLVLIYIGE